MVNAIKHFAVIGSGLMLILSLSYCLHQIFGGRDAMSERLCTPLSMQIIHWVISIAFTYVALKGV